MLEPPLLASCRLTWWAWTGIAEWRTGFSSLAHRGGGVVAAWNVLLTLAKERAARHWPSNSRQCLAALEESTTIISRRRRRRRRRPVHLVCSGPARSKLRRLLISQSVGLFAPKSSTKIKVKNKYLEQHVQGSIGALTVASEKCSWKTTRWVKKVSHPNHGYKLCQFLIDLQNSFTAAQNDKFPTKPILVYQPHLKYVSA